MQNHQIYLKKINFGFKRGIFIKFFFKKMGVFDSISFAKIRWYFLYVKYVWKKSFLFNFQKKEKKRFLECRINVVKKIQKKDVEKKGWKRKKKLAGKMVCE